MKGKHYLYIVIFLFTYLLNMTSALYTESLILFIALFLIFISHIRIKSLWTYKKTNIKWYELIIFYKIFKTWHRCMIRDTDIKIMNFLLLSLQMQKYEIDWMKQNIDKINNRDYVALKMIVLRRLEILLSYKKIMKLETSVSAIKRFPLDIE